VERKQLINKIVEKKSKFKKVPIKFLQNLRQTSQTSKKDFVIKTNLIKSLHRSPTGLFSHQDGTNNKIGFSTPKKEIEEAPAPRILKIRKRKQLKTLHNQFMANNSLSSSVETNKRHINISKLKSDLI